MVNNDDTSRINDCYEEINRFIDMYISDRINEKLEKCTIINQRFYG